jgi:hypothetical protein
MCGQDQGSVDMDGRFKGTFLSDRDFWIWVGYEFSTSYLFNDYAEVTVFDTLQLRYERSVILWQNLFAKEKSWKAINVYVAKLVAVILILPYCSCVLPKKIKHINSINTT